MQRPPEITVAALAEKDGQFLLIEERVNGALVLNQPAGHLENNETLLEAVARECKEESGWTFEPTHLCSIYTWQHPRRHVSVIRFAFCGIVTDHDTDSPLDDGILRSLWMSPKQMRDNRHRLRSPMVEQGVDDYLAGRRFPLEIVSEIASLYQSSGNWQFGS